jgi:hypothetical protein
VSTRLVEGSGLRDYSSFGSFTPHQAGTDSNITVLVTHKDCRTEDEGLQFCRMCIRNAIISFVTVATFVQLK